MRRTLNDEQVALLRWISDGQADGETPEGKRISARALHRRDLVKVTGRGPHWRAAITPTGAHYLAEGDYPPGHHLAKPRPAAEPVPAPALTPTAKRAPKPIKRENDWEVDSPRGMRERRRRPKGDGLFDERNPDPFDERILITVKEAAWLLSLTESAIYQAVRDGDLDRVYIGQGKTHYRVVYGSLLAWVNDMPREPAYQRWWH